MPEMIFVDSSNIEAIGYDDTVQELHVAFLSGSTYVYYGVPQEVYEELLSAASHGSYLNRAIKGTYTYAKL